MLYSELIAGKKKKKKKAVLLSLAVFVWIMRSFHSSFFLVTTYRYLRHILCFTLPNYSHFLFWLSRWILHLCWDFIVSTCRKAVAFPGCADLKRGRVFAKLKSLMGGLVRISKISKNYQRSCLVVAQCYYRSCKYC